MDQYGQLELLHIRAADQMRKYCAHIEIAREYYRLTAQGSCALIEANESNTDLHSSLAKRSLDSYHAIMDEIETIHASSFTV